MEGAAGLGHLLAQPLLAGGERVLDVPPKLAAKARLLSDGDTNKERPQRRPLSGGGRAAFGEGPPGRSRRLLGRMGMWSQRYLDLTARRTQVACRLHALLCELLPGGLPGVLRPPRPRKSSRRSTPDNPMDAARLALARQLLADLVRVDEQRRQTKKHMTDAVKASGTTVTEVYGVGPFVACAVIGHVGDVSRFATRAASPPTTAPPRSRCPQGRRRSTGCRGEATAGSTTPSTWLRSPRSSFANSPGRAYYQRKRAEGKTGKEALRALKRRISDVIYARLVADARAAGTLNRGPGGQAGNVSKSSTTGSHPAKPALRNSHSRTRPTLRPAASHHPKESRPSLLTQRGTRSGRGLGWPSRWTRPLQIGQYALPRSRMTLAEPRRWGAPIRRRFITVASASSSTLGSRAIERSAWSRVDPIVRVRRGLRR